MKTIMFVLVAALSIGCKKKTADGAGDCTKAINNSMSLSKAEMEKMPGMDATMMQKMTAVGIQRCNEDKWSSAAIKCMVDAKAMTDAQGCYDKLTPEQQGKMNKAAMELAMPPHGDAAGSAGSADAAGSAGSAAAGSADAAGSAGSAAAGSADAAGSAGSAAAGSADAAGSAGSATGSAK